MNCQEIWDGPADQLKDHLNECPACASEWAAHRSLTAGLRQVAAGWSRMAAPPRVEARLLSAFREHAGTAAEKRPHPWFAAFTWAMAAAAVLVLAVSLLRVHGPQTATPRPVPGNAAILASLDEMPEFAGEASAAEASDGGFVPLPNVEQLAPNETGDVVRVEVPRSAMIAVGFEVSPERATEPVQAEVMFGPDGVARAVRFLNETF
jgi:hypothetical protein